MGTLKFQEYFGKKRLSKPVRVALVVSDFNRFITEKLYEGALSVLENEESVVEIHTYHVPGSFEIPLVVSRILSKLPVDGVIALGAIIRGETPHFEYVAKPVSNALMNLALEYKKPVVFGVLTTDTVEQALNRAGIKYGNKGCDAANTLLSLLSLFEESSL